MQSHTIFEWCRLMINGSTSNMPTPFLWDYVNDNNGLI